MLENCDTQLISASTVAENKKENIVKGLHLTDLTSKLNFPKKHGPRGSYGERNF